MASTLLKDVTESLTLPSDDSEERYIISGVSWQQYETLLEQLGNNPWYRVTFLEGVLEIVSPSRKHESKKDNIARLLGVYFEETRTRFYGLGSTTFQETLKNRGVEPDTCFCIGSEKEFPDLAVEVIETSGGINKLEVYKRLGVPEVWFWKDEAFQVYRLRGHDYEQITTSELLPDLDLKLMATYVEHSEPLDAVLEFRQKVREQLQL
jgi:Uma2 family endonuclease